MFLFGAEGNGERNKKASWFKRLFVGRGVGVCGKNMCFEHLWQNPDYVREAGTDGTWIMIQQQNKSVLPFGGIQIPRDPITLSNDDWGV